MGTLKFFEKGQRQLSLGLVALTFLALLLAPLTPAKAENGDPEGWRYAGLTFPQLLFPTTNSLCFEGNLPGNLLIGSHNQSEWGAPGTYRYNWQSGQLSKISDLDFEGLSANCSPNLN